MTDLFKEEANHLDLGDTRRNNRFFKIVDGVLKHPTASIPQSAPSWYDTKATYTFFKSSKVEESQISKAITYATRDRALQEDIILNIQDTSNISFNSDAEGLGYLDRGKKGKGLMLHNSLAVSTTGHPLGLLDQYIWERPFEERGKKATRHQRSIEDKESYRWITSLKTSEQLLINANQIVTIADREADIYELFSERRPDNSDLLIRATHNRKTKEGNKVWDQISAMKIMGNLSLEIQKADGRMPRIANLTIRYSTIELLPPPNLKLPNINLQAILVLEEGSIPFGETAISWKLLTTLPINHISDALKYVEWYGYRWLIERFHFVLKSGCKVEDLQLRTVQQLRKALITYSLAAYRLLWLSYEARRDPEQTCEVIFHPHEWQALYAKTFKTFAAPELVPTLRECIIWTARLGGFLARKSDGMPGVKNLWRGMRRLQDIAEMWLIHQRGSYKHSYSFG